MDMHLSHITISDVGQRDMTSESDFSVNSTNENVCFSGVPMSGENLRSGAKERKVPIASAEEVASATMPPVQGNNVKLFFDTCKKISIER